MTADSAIKVTITNPQNSTQTIIEDWKINTVSRESEDIGSFEASYLSTESKKYSWVALYVPGMIEKEEFFSSSFN